MTFTENNMVLEAVFVGNGASQGSHGRIISDEEKRLLDEWLGNLNKNLPYGNSAKKTATVYDYENRIYKVNLEAKSNLETIDGEVGIGFVLDSSMSMKFPSKLVKAFGDDSEMSIANINDWHCADNNTPGQTKYTYNNKTYIFYKNQSYYVISDEAGTATVYEIYHDGSNWKRLDASKDKNNSANYETISDSTWFSQNLDGVRETAGNRTFTVFQDGDNGLQRRHYLEKSVADTINDLNDLLDKVQIAADSDDNPDVQVAWTTFAKNVGGKNQDCYNTTFHSVSDPSEIDFGIEEGDYDGGTSTDYALSANYSGSAYYFDWDSIENEDNRYVILITDGAPQRSGYSVPNPTVQAEANALKSNKHVKLITVGLSMDSVENGRKLLGSASDTSIEGIADSIDGEAMFFEAEDGSQLQYILYQIIKTIMKDATVQSEIKDTIDPAFYPVDASGKALDAGTMIDINGNVTTDSSVPHGTITLENGNYVVTWNGTNNEGEDVSTDGWKGTVFIKAKEDFLGGNAIETNKGKATVTPKTYKATETSSPVALSSTLLAPSELDSPQVNVDELLITEHSTEWTVYLGTDVSPQEQLEALYEQVKVQKVVSSSGSDNRNTGDLSYEHVADSNNNNVHSELPDATAEKFKPEILELSTTEWEALKRGEEITRWYSAYEHERVGTVTISLTKTVNDASVEDPYKTHPSTGEETYVLKITYTPVPGGELNTNKAGHITNTMNSTNKHDIHVYAKDLDITKIGAGDEPIKNNPAKFDLYRKMVEGETVDSDKQATLKVNGVDTDVVLVKKDLTTSSSGVIKLESLSYPPDGVYYLEETEAPVNYFQLTEPVVIQMTPMNSYKDVNGVDSTLGQVQGKPYNMTTDSMTLTCDTQSKTLRQIDEDSYAVSVRNIPNYNLPSAGGSGTYLYTIFGVAMFSTAALLLAKDRRALLRRRSRRRGTR